MSIIIDGKGIAEKIKDNVKEEVLKLNKEGIQPGLAVVIVEGDPASRIYVNNKKKACESVGIYSQEYTLSQQITQDELITLIDSLNDDTSIHGILVQLPLPKHLNEKEVINRISPIKDVDAFHPQNVGKIMLGDYDFLPCTPAGIMEILNHENINIEGKNCVVIGRSNIVGKPMSMLMLHANATVTICHSKTRNLKEICKSADIIIAAVGKANFVTKDMVKDEAVVIDVGINRGEDGKLCGDVKFDEVKDKASYITPVPGGVGPMTIAMLMKNTITAAKLQHNLKQ